MDGLFHGKPYEQMDDLGVFHTPIFGLTPICTLFVAISVPCDGSLFIILLMFIACAFLCLYNMCVTRTFVGQQELGKEPAALHLLWHNRDDAATWKDKHHET